MTEDAAHVPASYAKLLVGDADRMLAFYTRLGFTLVHRDPLFTHLRWAPQADLFLVSTPAAATIEARRGVGVILCFDARHVSLDELARRAGSAVVDGPRSQPWHTRELLVADPEGYRLAFVTPDAVQ